MGLLSGSASVTRFTVVSQPEEPDFEAARFVEIEPGSSIRERIGFLPFEPEAPYRVGQHRLAFRVRIDRLRPDPTAVRERVKGMVKAELEATGNDRVSTRRRREMRQLAEEELIVRTTPRSKVIECCIDGTKLYVGSTANAYLGIETEVYDSWIELLDERLQHIDALFDLLDQKYSTLRNRLA